MEARQQHGTILARVSMRCGQYFLALEVEYVVLRCSEVLSNRVGMDIVHLLKLRDGNRLYSDWNGGYLNLKIMSAAILAQF